jgi:hypothetical protein
MLTTKFINRLLITENDLHVVCRDQVSTWSSGTGAAGVLGALSYAGLTALHVSPSTTLLIMLIVPCILGITYVR